MPLSGLEPLKNESLTLVMTYMTEHFKRERWRKEEDSNLIQTAVHILKLGPYPIFSHCRKTLITQPSINMYGRIAYHWKEEKCRFKVVLFNLLYSQ